MGNIPLAFEATVAGSSLAPLDELARHRPRAKLSAPAPRFPAFHFRNIREGVAARSRAARGRAIAHAMRRKEDESIP